MKKNVMNYNNKWKRIKEAVTRDFSRYSGNRENGMASELRLEWPNR